MTGDRTGGKIPLYRKVSEEIRRDIVMGIYVPGEILPSIRDKAKSLGVARNTVDTAYQILAEEGYIRSRRGVGYEVLDYRESFNYEMGGNGESQDTLHNSGESDAVIDFRGSRRMSGWLTGKNWNEISAELCGELQDATDNAGLRLRQQIRRYLKKHRGVTCSDDQIFLYRDCRQAAQMIRRIKPQLLYTIPHHEGYLGNHISPEEGRMLLKRLGEKDVYMFEDDLDSELVYGKRPYSTLYEEDTQGRVILTGTFERVLGSFMQMRYVVYPREILRENRQLFASASGDSHHSLLELKSLEVIMRSKGWENFLRKTNHRYSVKRDLLTDKIRRTFGEETLLYRTESGPEIIAVFPYCGDEECFAQKAREAGINVSARLGRNTPGGSRRLYVTLNYCAVPDEQIGQGIDLLAEVLGRVSNP